MTSRRAAIELCFASLLWGFGFVASVWALKAFSPLWVTFLRFTLAGLISLVWAFFSKDHVRIQKSDLKLAFVPGVLLFSMLILQTWGLIYTSATKSGFITCLYVLFVPIFERVFLKRALSPLHFIFVIAALIGTALICDFQTGDWNRGDLITLACSIVASAQIFWFAVIQKKIGSALKFNGLQSLWSAAVCLIFLISPIAGPVPTWPVPSIAWIGLGALTIGSTVIAFALQVRAQKFITPSTASLLYLLESPFALLFAIFFLKEGLSPIQAAGAFIILISILASLKSEIPADLSTLPA